MVSREDLAAGVHYFGVPIFLTLRSSSAKSPRDRIRARDSLLSDPLYALKVDSGVSKKNIQ